MDSAIFFVKTIIYRMSISSLMGNTNISWNLSRIFMTVGKHTFYQHFRLEFMNNYSEKKLSLLYIYKFTTFINLVGLLKRNIITKIFHGIQFPLSIFVCLFVYSQILYQQHNIAHCVHRCRGTSNPGCWQTFLRPLPGLQEQGKPPCHCQLLLQIAAPNMILLH